ncbi:MAG: dipeptidyl aminopeptidase/acylaminoacyl peptidase [Flavobacteriaceae bacterium]|jgi:dipeptidyl aminopeptidase/acylaminoacyl peptidase
MKNIATLLILIITTYSYSQATENKSALELSEIMKGNSFIGNQPENIRWSLNGKHILFDWNPHDQPGNSTFSYSLKARAIDSLHADYFLTSTDYYGGQIYATEIYSEDGNLYRFDRKKDETQLILKSLQSIRNIQRTGGSESIYFQQGNGFYSYDLASRTIEQLAEIKMVANESDPKPTYFEEEELALFQFIKDQKEAKEWRKAKSTSWNHDVPIISYPRGSHSSIQIDGTGKFITFRVDHYPTGGKKTHVDHHISASGYTTQRSAREKVSDEDPTHQLGIYNLELDTTYFVDFSTLSDIRRKPKYLKDYGDDERLYEVDRNIIMHKMIYSPNGESNVIDVRSYDNKDRWIVSVDLKTGKIKMLNHQHDEAWIGGPGISSWNMVSGNLGWIDNETVHFQSEESGFSHLYSINVHSEKLNQLTSGNWEVHNATLSGKKDRFYITANKNHAGNREFYHLIIKTKELIPILTLDGNHEVSISPDEKTLAIRHSTKIKPWELYTAMNKRDALLVQVTKSTSKEFKRYDWHSPEVISFKAEDGEMVPARIFKPEAANSNGAAVIFVHGAGYLQNAHNYWSGYYREFMFHNLLRDNGYTVLDIDYRASKGYGRDHRTAIYRHMGGKDLSDQVDGRDYLIKEHSIDPTKVGMYGGSYGGFITIMALLNEPGKFQCGAAIRSVTDWFHYNHEYTTNILNYPSSDPDAYKKSSPIYFADKLEDHLLMLHGMVDDNVHYQDVVRLSQRFIELGKKDWDLVGYPVEAHGFKKASSWVDEYRRIYELFNQELLNK